MSMKKVYQIHHFPKVGRLVVACNTQNQLVLVSNASRTPIAPGWVLAQSLEGEQAEKYTVLQKTIQQLEEYFRRERKKVWKHMKESLLYGQTVSYSGLAKQVSAKYNIKTSARAMGSTNRLNPLMLIVPCHRVIGADGNLVGFAGGLSLKEYLLKLESAEAVMKTAEPHSKKRKLEEPSNVDLL